jgi:hypothetical protein
MEKIFAISTESAALPWVEKSRQIYLAEVGELA